MIVMVAESIIAQLFGAPVGDVTTAVLTGLAGVLIVYTVVKVVITPGALAAIVSVWLAMIKMVTDVVTMVITLFREKG